VEKAEKFYSRGRPIKWAFQKQFLCISVGKASVSEGPGNKMTGGSENERGKRSFSYKSSNRITFEATMLFDFTELRALSVIPLSYVI
jgi:hypothetical protein